MSSRRRLSKRLDSVPPNPSWNATPSCSTVTRLPCRRLVRIARAHPNHSLRHHSELADTLATATSERCGKHFTIPRHARSVGMRDRCRPFAAVKIAAGLAGFFGLGGSGDILRRLLSPRGGQSRWLQPTVRSLLRVPVPIVGSQEHVEISETVARTGFARKATKRPWSVPTTRPASRSKWCSPTRPTIRVRSTTSPNST